MTLQLGFDIESLIDEATLETAGPWKGAPLDYTTDYYPEQFDVFMAGYEAGRASGLDDGYQACEDAYATRHRIAYEVMTRTHDFIAPDEIPADYG